MILCNRLGAPRADAEHLAAYRSAVAQRADKRHTQGIADEMPGGADVLLALSGPAAISAAARGTAAWAIVFAMANPGHEVHPEEIRDHVGDHRHGTL